jgi:biopolymer transport protein ExbD
MKSRIHKTEPEAALDISPLIDMVFILLIFFMVSSSFIKDMQLDLERPSAQTSTLASSRVVRVHVDKRGEIYIAEAPVKVWMLQSRVRDMLAQSGQKHVLVVVDGDVSSQRLVEVVDQCRLGGAEHVGVATVAEAG